ncbi:MarR family winged helix-turn-helix transcriptional regulator [Polymorphobacter sp. PAMC 29334]|uniref:MarR family winged helix-turn-helix transcriptional regulator n=1 Tax=Polymorphobacter sp. PAMC 29334 TaxID=2862331 RepID=UPI001C745085|nr:MarR family winged helix-turn-helix transcriptional regulator [Polymorphobacter sp. PAMC 29334]QYE34476.1 MarR family winged helix-turn-helix transcriptional regulator [Polymorphobacter sp. PAMC 29334]
MALRFGDVTTLCAVSPAWADRYRDALAGEGLAVGFVADGAALTATLADHWTIDVVVLDLALATPALAARLSASGPRVLAFGNPEHAGLALASNLADFIAEVPAAADLVAAIREAAAAPTAAGVADRSDQSSARLGALGAEAERVAAALARLIAPTDASDPPPVDPGAIRQIVRARRARDRYFPADIFADPAWDMLLDLTAARAEGQPVSVSSLCIAACVPPTTALRWIRTLCDAGLFERASDPGDARRAFIALAEPTARAMARYLGVFVRPENQDPR